MRINWLEQAKSQDCSHFIIMFDSEDKEEYAVFVGKSDSLKTMLAKLLLSERKQVLVDVVSV
jgi:hypothetical protein